MNIYNQQIKKMGTNNRVALTRQYPVLLPVILETKILLRSLRYNLNPIFNFKKQTIGTQFNLIEHSSPLFRKFNARELDEGKIENINIAIKHLNGIIIPPGTVFSFWKHVGRPTVKKGFKKGLVLSGGQLKEDIGGGLCQLSNLIAYMFACTECYFVERKHHSKDVFPDSGRTIPFASGATVFFNLIDLKVKNTYSFPLKLNLHTTATQLRGSISAPIQLDYSIKIKETDSAFIKVGTNKIYRCNTLKRIYYEKHTHEQIKQNLLWVNVAEVMYDEKNIKKPILSLDESVYN